MSSSESKTGTAQIGVTGLAVMGSNLARNFAHHGYTVALHNRFLATMNIAPEGDDPSNKLIDVESQLRWLREIGFVEVDCHWKWRELALVAGRKCGPVPA